MKRRTTRRFVVAWWFFLCASSILPRSSASGCRDQCSLEELKAFWSDCCCLPRTVTTYHDSTGAVVCVSPDSLPDWVVCRKSPGVFVWYAISFFFLIQLYGNIRYWFEGHALAPTQVVQLSAPSGGRQGGGEESLDPGPKGTPSGDFVRYVFLRSTAISDDPTNSGESQHGGTTTTTGYSATVELFHRKGASASAFASDGPRVRIPLKSSDAHRQLQEYCRARDGKWWEKATKDASHPTNGYRLLLLTGATVDDDDDDDDDDNHRHHRLVMYRPYRYDARWKWNITLDLFVCCSYTMDLLLEVRPRLSLPIVFFANVVAVLITNLVRVEIRQPPGSSGSPGANRGSALRDPLFDPEEVRGDPGARLSLA